MATWSVTGGKAVLTLEAGDVGQISRWQTFTAADGIQPSELHTFYLEVKSPSSSLRAFAEVEGGDRVEAAGTGAIETLAFGGISNASAEIKVRFGVLASEEGGGGGASDLMDHASKADAEADGWVFENLATAGVNQTIWGSYNPVFRLSGPGSSFATPAFYKDFNLTPGVAYRARMLANSPSGGWWISTSHSLTRPEDNASRSSQGLSAGGGDRELITEISTGITAGASGVLRFKYGTNGWSDYSFAFYAARLLIEPVGAGGSVVEFDNLSFCVGSGLPDDDEDPDVDPPPDGGPWPPPPVGGARPFIIHNIPVTGAAYWNGTMIAITAQRAANILNQARDAGCYLFPRFGPEPDWLDGSGRFEYSRWEDKIDEFAANASAMAALAAAIADRTAFAHYIIDEPFHLTRYGGPIPYATVEKMAMKSKEVWPTWTTLMRVDPSDARYPRKMVGLDWMWAEYSLARGPISDYRRIRYTAASDWGHGLVVGLHWKHFAGPQGPSPRYITPNEVATIGHELATPWPGTTPSVAFGGWKYETGLVAQAGMLDKVRDLRDYYASLD